MERMQQASVIVMVLLLGVAFPAPTAQAGVTNIAPWSDSFESNAVGTLLQGPQGWSPVKTGAGWVTNPPPELEALTNTYAGSYAYPLPAASHTNLAAVNDLLGNNIVSSTGGVVALDLLAMPTWGDRDPPGKTNHQYGLYVKTNQHLVIWQRSLGPPATNRWLELTGGPSVNTGVWTRFTFLLNYSNGMYQVKVNGGSPISDAAGYQSDGTTPNGPWFHMVQTNGFLSRVTLGDGGTNYVDDVVVSPRTLTWAPGGFTESVTNNGTFDGGAPVVATLTYDTFTGGEGADLTGYVVVESGLPDGLSVAARRASATSAELTLINAATAHEAINYEGALTVRFTDGAFTLGQAADVSGYRKTDLTVTFRDTATLGFSTNRFDELIPLNNGTISNTPVTITLEGDEFTGAVGEDYGTNTAKLVIMGLPAGLTGRVEKVDSGHLELTLLGQAVANATSNNTSFTLEFQAGAFTTNVLASTVVNYTNAVEIHYADSPELAYTTTNFVEMAINDGTVTGTTVTLAYDVFSGSEGQDLAAEGWVTGTLPAGLVLRVIKVSDYEATVVFSNKATAHAAGDSWAGTASIHFLNGAFAGNNAAGVAGATRDNLSVTFLAQPELTLPDGLVFTESSANNGSIGNSLTVVLTGDTFVGDLTGLYTVDNVPNGLTAQLVRDSDTQVTVSLADNASPHTAGQSRSDVLLTFAEGAFSTVGAANVIGSATNLTVTFANAPELTYSGDTFNELSFGTMDNRTPMTITLSGDTFVAGADFSSWVTVANLPGDLVAVFTRDSDTQLTVTLTGTATNHASGDTIHTLGFTFNQGAFANADANQVVNYAKTGMHVVFVDDLAFVNTVPYLESFEGYAEGTLLAGTNAWTADYYADAVEVTNAAGLTDLLTDYDTAGGNTPITTNHTKVLLVRDSVRNEIHSEAGTQIYLDFLMVPEPMQGAPVRNTNMQFGFYVNTNQRVVIWHRNTTGATPTNEWLTLTNNAPLVEPNMWSRFTVAQNYASKMFQIRVNEGTAISDPAGWDASGLIQTGSWFHMVNTNADTMSRMLVSGVGTAYLDDLTVVTSLPSDFAKRRATGSIYRLR